jgi:hypothetical protein
MAASYTPAEDPFGYRAQRDRMAAEAEQMKVLHSDGNLWLRGKLSLAKGTAAPEGTAPQGTAIIEAGICQVLNAMRDGDVITLANGAVVERSGDDWLVNGEPDEPWSDDDEQ